MKRTVLETAVRLVMGAVVFSPALPACAQTLKGLNGDKPSLNKPVIKRMDAAPHETAAKPAPQKKNKKKARKPAARKAAAKKPKPKYPADRMLAAGMKALDHGQNDDAIAAFQKAVRKRPAADRYFLLGYAHYQRGFQTGAPETADKLDAVKVVENYKTALALDPKLTEVTQPYKLYHSLGMAYEALGLEDKAIVAYRDAFLSSPKNLALPLYGARLRLKMGATHKSLANLSMALKQAHEAGQDASVLAFMRARPLFSDLLRSPEHAQLVAQYSAPAAPPKKGALVAMEPLIPANDAYGLRDSVRGTGPSKSLAPPAGEDQAVLDAIAAANDEFKFHKWTRAIEGYQKALSIHRTSRTLGDGQVAFVEERVGAAYNKLGRTTLAITSLERSVQARHFNCNAHYQLALAYSVAGHYKDALAALHDALSTAPSPSERRKFILMAKTDSELDPIRDLPVYHDVIDAFADHPASAKQR